MYIIAALLGLFTTSFREYLHNYQTKNLVKKFIRIPRFDRLLVAVILTAIHYLMLPLILFFYFNGADGEYVEVYVIPSLAITIIAGIILSCRIINDVIQLKKLLDDDSFWFYQGTIVGMVLWYLLKKQKPEHAK